MEDESDPMLAMTAEIVGSYVGANRLEASEVAELIRDTHRALLAAREGKGAELEPAQAQKPAVTIRKSVTPDYIVCLEDGRKMKSLKRHLAAHGMTPAEYRAKWKLPSEYPMVAATYAEARSSVARASGLGQKRSSADRGSGRKRKQT